MRIELMSLHTYENIARRYCLFVCETKKWGKQFGKTFIHAVG